MGCVSNIELYCAMSEINEKMGLIERIVEKQEYNKSGVYYCLLNWEGA